MIVCPKCGTTSESGQLVCTKCGTLLFNPSSSTVHMRIDPTLLRLRRHRQQGSDVRLPERTISLQIRGMSERLNFEEGTAIILGRTDLTAAHSTHLDLSRYGAHERGVSREHAMLRFADNQITVTDLNSVNGTSVNLTRLKPNQPYTLKSGDELMLGTLSIVVNFELNTEPKKPAEPKSTGQDDTQRFKPGMVPGLPGTKALDPEAIDRQIQLAKRTIEVQGSLDNTEITDGQAQAPSAPASGIDQEPQ